MNTQNMLAIIAMLAIVVTLYALRSGHACYLLDMLALALALVAPRQSMAIGAWLVLVLVRHTRLAYGLAGSIPVWLHPIAIPAACDMSISNQESSDLESAYKARISESETAPANDETTRPVAEKTAEIIVLAEIRAIARLVAAGKLKRTEAIQIGTGKKSGAAYQERTKLLDQELDRIRNHYPPGSTLSRFE